MELLKLMEERYSVRKFADTPIEAEKLEKILRAAQLAPTAKNIQPLKIYLVRSEEKLAGLDEATRCRYGAPLVAVVCYDDEAIWHNPFKDEIHSGDVDATIVADHMILEAWSQGIGSCWVMWFEHAKVQEALGLSDHIHPVVLIPLGYAAEDAEPAGRHFKRKETTELFEEI